jgi:hypothetical protein
MRLLFVRFLGRLAEARARVETSGLRLVAVVLVLAALEAFGRVSPSDWVDGIGVALLASSAGLLFATRAEPWKRRGRALRALARRVLLPARLRYGLDLRGAPPLSEAVPWRTVGAGAASLAVLALLWATRDAFPGPAREALRTISGLLWLALLGLSWAALGFVVLATWFVLAAFLRRETRDLRSARGIAFALFGAVVLAAPRLPARWASRPRCSRPWCSRSSSRSPRARCACAGATRPSRARAQRSAGAASAPSKAAPRCGS